MAGNSPALTLGFADPVAQSQATFRALLDAMARPGRVIDAPPVPAGPLPQAMAAAALTLADIETPVWLSDRMADAAAWLRFHCGCPVAGSPGRARFAFATHQDVLPPLDSFELGTDESPDRSTTLILEVAALDVNDAGLRLSGPGIRGSSKIAVGGLPEEFWRERAVLHELFPRGVDIVLTSGARLAGVPRTTRVEV